MSVLDDVPRWVWEDPRRLTCSGDWRIVTRPADGVPLYRDERHMHTVVFGRAEHFRNGDRAVELLRTLCGRLHLDRDRWNHQAAFYRAFIDSFYSVGDGSAPAWMKIAPTRLNFRNRMSTANAAATQTAAVAERLFDARHWGYETIVLNGANLPTNALLMRGSPGARLRQLRLYKMTIQRKLAQDGFGKPVTCSEDWLFLGTSASEERAARKRGQNFTIQSFPKADPLGRMSPLVSLCRMSNDRRWIYSRCVSLCPGVGDALDFRSVTHSTPFYFRSDLSNAGLIGRAMTPRMSERF